MRYAALGIAEEVSHYFVVGELVSWRQQRMCLRSALYLFDLDQRLVPHPILGVCSIDRAALEVDLGRIHASVRQVGVVRDRQQVVALATLAVHPLPEVGGNIGIQRAERRGWHVRTVLEEDVAMEVY